eukprot:2404614-Ditylum_brightwellii.AAC.1
MQVMVFAAKFEHFNSLVKYCPEVNGQDPDPLKEAEKITAFKKACPQSWVTDMVKANLNFTIFNKLTTYYNRLKTVEPKTNYNNRNNNGNKRKWNSNNQCQNNYNQHQNNNRNNGNNNGRNNNNFEPCPIHGNQHSRGVCHLLRQIMEEERTNYQNRNRNRNGNNNGRQNYSNGNNNRSNYNTWSNNNNNNNNEENNAVHGRGQRSNWQYLYHGRNQNRNNRNNTTRNVSFTEESADANLNNMQEYDEIYMLSNRLAEFIESNDSSTTPTPQTIFNPAPEPTDEPEPPSNSTHHHQQPSRSPVVLEEIMPLQT